MSATKAKPTGKIPAKPGKETVYVDIDDEITGIIDKVDSTKEKIVALVLPKRSTALQSIVNMRLLRRSADNSGKSVVLITHEPALLPLAGAAGLHVAESLHGTPEIPPSPRPDAPAPPAEDIPGDDSELDEGKAKLDYHRSIGELASANALDESEEINLGEDDEANNAAEKSDKTAKKAKAAKIKVPNFDRFRIMLGLGLLALIALIVFIILAVSVLPKATITIQTTSLPVTANLALNAADSVKTLDETGNNIPAILKSSDQTSTESVQATGQQNNGTKATGKITITNCSKDGSERDIPAGSGITSSGLTFITQEAAVLPSSTPNCKSFDGVTSKTVDVTAQTAGAKYNLSSATFSVSGNSDVTASGSTSGGTDSIVMVVSQADLNSAQNKVSSTDASSFTKAFETQATNSGLYILTSTLKAGTPVVTSTPAIGQPASSVTATIKTTYTILAVQKADLQKVITDALNKQINSKEQKLNTSNVLGDATVTVQSQGSPTTATLSVSENTTAVPILNIASIKKESVGQKTGDIQSTINKLPGVKNVTVKLSPFWISKAPKASKITVVQQQVKSGS
jgi:hypothetical protein